VPFTSYLDFSTWCPKVKIECELNECFKVVEPFSAILDLPNERALPISADHRSMVRFSVLEEEKFRPVWNAITELIRAPESTISGRSRNALPDIK
jgi:hypothetical protein